MFIIITSITFKKFFFEIHNTIRVTSTTDGQKNRKNEENKCIYLQNVGNTLKNFEFRNIRLRYSAE